MVCPGLDTMLSVILPVMMVLVLTQALYFGYKFMLAFGITLKKDQRARIVSGVTQVLAGLQHTEISIPRPA